MDYKQYCEERVGQTFRHRFTGQIRQIVVANKTVGVLFNQARWYGWGPFMSSSFYRTYYGAYRWLRHADMIAERGQLVKTFSE